jgi:4-hydroxybenzoate polyprenyltransferase
MAVLLIGLGVWGIPQLNLAHFGILIAACIIEEIINTHWLDKGKLGHGVIMRLFSLRPVLEIAAFGISLASGLWLIWLTLLAFDIGYVLITKFGERKIARSSKLNGRRLPTGSRISRRRR